MSADSKKQVFVSNLPLDKFASVRYDTYFRMLGLLSVQLDPNFIRSSPVTAPNTTGTGGGGAGANVSGDGSNIILASWMRRLYCRIVCTMLWFFTIRSFVLMFIWDRSVQLMLGDLTGYWNDYRMYYLMPMLFVSLQTAITSSIFLSKEKDLGWLVPFFSLRQTLSNNLHSERYNRYSAKDFRLRIYFGIMFGMTFVAIVTTAVGWVYFNTAWGALDETTFKWIIPWLALQVLWFFYMAGTIVFSMTYFNLVCIMVTRRFHHVFKDIERLAEQESLPSQVKNTALNKLYFEHNEICELVDEGNAFWQTYIFYVYMTSIPCACYTLYNLFFAEPDELLTTTTWSVFLGVVFLVAFISLSAAGVSAEAHAPYTPLHTLSLLQLPIDLEVNMSTFLHRVRGPTIGFSCLDLFVVTNASISNTVAAVASYFLIVADFSRSTVAASEASARARAAQAALKANSTNLTDSLMDAGTTMMALATSSINQN